MAYQKKLVNEWKGIKSIRLRQMECILQYFFIKPRLQTDFFKKYSSKITFQDFLRITKQCILSVDYTELKNNRDDNTINLLILRL